MTKRDELTDPTSCMSRARDDARLACGGEAGDGGHDVKAQTESVLVRSILAYLALRGIIAWRNNNAGVRRRAKDGREFWTFAGRKGVGDVTAILPGGRACFIEAKLPGGKLSEDQKTFIDDVNAAGAVAFVARSLKDV